MLLTYFTLLYLLTYLRVKRCEGGVKRQLPAHRLIHAHARIFNILGHGYKLMAISLLALAFGDLSCAAAKAQAMAMARGMA